MKIPGLIMLAAGLAVVCCRAGEINLTVEPADADAILIPLKPETTKIEKISGKDGQHIWKAEGPPGDMLSLYVKRTQFVTALEFVPASGKELKIALKYSTQYAEAIQNADFREKIAQEANRARNEVRQKARAALLQKYKDRGEKIAKALREETPTAGMPAEMIIFIFGEPTTRTSSQGVGGKDDTLTYNPPNITFYFTNDKLTRWVPMGRKP